MIIPINISLKLWADSLIIDFPDDNVPILRDESDWKSWGNFLVQENTFVNNGAPGTVAYSDWKQWAQDVFKTMANY